MNEEIFEKIAEKHNSDYVRIDAQNSQIWLQIQDGAIKENGENGCQIEKLGEIWLDILNKFNEKFQCIQNDKTITFLKWALEEQKKRKLDREERKVEGYNKK